MARRRGCARGACVNRAEAGGGAKSARAPPKFEGPISGLNDPAVFALRSQATVPFPLTVLAGVTIPIFLRRTQIQRMAAGLWPFLDVKHATFRPYLSTAPLLHKLHQIQFYCSQEYCTIINIKKGLGI
ncbi:hypothetical protein mRhiFer1_009256 [Rhinolophus ferrumequinum]|uniref:Uncharacterized protein n=1 Tax=Rhinolophus ferrumequinum TaxID=59479 RepID=A0A7J7S817_RHIFE|nr:hypothetical protein mRhiFer1_009256 [Rhinolophus ferrumequinum]